MSLFCVYNDVNKGFFIPIVIVILHNNAIKCNMVLNFVWAEKDKVTLVNKFSCQTMRYLSRVYAIYMSML